MPTLLAYVLLFTAIAAFFIFIHLVIGRFVRPNRPDAEKLTVYECGEPTIGSAWVQFDLRFYVVALLFVIFDVEMAFFFPWAVVFGKANALASNSISQEQRVADIALLDPRERADITDPDRIEAERAKKQEKFDARIKKMEEMLRDPEKARADNNKRRAELIAKHDALPGNSMERVPLSEEIGALEFDNAILDSLPDKLKALKARGPEPLKRDVLIKDSKPVSEQFAWLAFVDILVFFAVLLLGFAYLWRRGDLDWVRSIAAQRLNPEEAREPVAKV
jgi:NADH-quinone oxidoreductase subunit A